MMTDTLTLALALGMGMALGGMFFGGLWWTVRKGLASQRPALLFLGSFLLRTSIALAGLYFVAGGDWHRLLACLFGFVMTRLIVTKRLGVPVGTPTSPANEAGHAS
jgi:F1F0 ATPase subunit 2